MNENRIDFTTEKFDRIVMLYKSEGEIYLGHSFIYRGRDGSKYLLFLYKEPLPMNDVLDGWNYLDENSVKITIVPENTHEMAINDFLFAHGGKVVKQSFETVDDFSIMNEMMKNRDMIDDEMIGFIIV